MDVSSALSTIATVIAIVSAGGLSLQRSRVTALRQDVQDEKQRSDGLRRDIGDLQRENASQAAEITQLKSDLRHAEQMVLGETHWTEIDMRLEGIEKSSKDADDHVRQVLALIREMKGGRDAAARS